VQKDLVFTAPKTALLDYYFYQKLAMLRPDTRNKLGVGMDITVIDA